MKAAALKLPGIRTELVSAFLQIHPAPWTISAGNRERSFYKPQDLIKFVILAQESHQAVALKLPSTQFVIVVAPHDARPASISHPPTHCILAGSQWLLWRMNEAITQQQGRAAAEMLAKELRGAKPSTDMIVPIPGTIWAIRDGVRLIGTSQVLAMLPRNFSYRIHNGRIVDAQATKATIPARKAPAGKAVLLGYDTSKQPIHWAPFETEQRLLNFGVLVTGDSGSGKTQTLRVLIDGVVKMGVPVCIFDFKNDYADKAFTTRQGLRVHDVRRCGMPFNPLLPSPGRDGKAQPIEHIFTIAGVLKRVFGLGDRQAALLRDSIKKAFELQGVDTQKWLPVASIAVPSFNDVVALIRSEKSTTATSLFDRVSPLFDLGLFPDAQKTDKPFEAMLEERVVLSLFELPTDEIKAAMAELIIIRMHGYLVHREQPRKLTRLLVLDEAWRVTSSKHLENLAREGRAFGVGLAIGTQYPGDLPPELSGSLATRIFLKNQQPDHRKAVIAAVAGGAGTQAQEVAKFLERQEMFQAIIQSQHFAPYAMVKIVPYYER